jgi:hypothetical protein
MPVSPCVYIKMQAEEIKTLGLLGVVDLAHACGLLLFCDLQVVVLQLRSQTDFFFKYNDSFLIKLKFLKSKSNNSKQILKSSALG